MYGFRVIGFRNFVYRPEPPIEHDVLEGESEPCQQYKWVSFVLLLACVQLSTVQVGFICIVVGMRAAVNSRNGFHLYCC
jgi:hypothetical protein